MGPPGEMPTLRPDPAAVQRAARRTARLEAALQAGWVIRYDLELDEYLAARTVLKSRTVEGLLDAIDEKGAAGA